MSENVVTLSSNSIDKAINEYHNTTSYSGSSSSTSSSGSSSEGNSMDEGYTFGVPRVPLEIVQEQLRKRAASGSHVGTSTSPPPSSPLDEEETFYSCAVSVNSKTYEQRLNNLRTWYQIPDELNPRLAVHEEWCCNPGFGKDVYEAYFLGGFRLPLNVFARELLIRLGLAMCQFNPNA